MLIPMETTRFSYLEYQALLLSLAAAMCVGLMVLEVALSRFQVLPLLYPGMFSVRDRRFLFFGFDISNGQMGKRIRGDAKMLIRVTLCVVFSYLWQHCVLEATQQVGTVFPEEQCRLGSDCFASDLDVKVFFNRRFKAIDCKGSPQPFDSPMVVSCIRFITPSATNWFMHLAIAHSVSQLNLKFYELLVWIAGNSARVRRVMCFLVFFSLSLFLAGLIFGELVATKVMSEFVSSWLSFVMCLSIPIFWFTVWTSSTNLQILWRDDAARFQAALDEHLDSAFAEIEEKILSTRPVDGDAAASEGSPRARSAGKKTYRERFSLMRGSLSAKNMRNLLRALPRRTFRRRAPLPEVKASDDESRDHANAEDQEQQVPSQP
eukprot:TRINITY_DN35051_c0_g1_i1.p1 TRINITY_DN35051_c0_g1~~TRINITY_DN35051_c0_g1_i1.p1  ORF type:complete len:376 (-),score=63.39 TRINITY_DN35051_c0_g1_i1:84-1211(-)